MTDIADQFQNRLTGRSEKWGTPVLEPRDGDESRRNKFVEPYFRDAIPNQVMAILKAREPVRILVAIGQRWVNQFNRYVNDQH